MNNVAACGVAVLTSAVSLGGGAGGSRGELGARLAGSVARAVAYILTRHPRAPLAADAALAHRLLHTLPDGQRRDVHANMTNITHGFYHHEMYSCLIQYSVYCYGSVGSKLF